MAYPRLIARLDVKGPNLIKTVHLEGLRVMGAPQEYAQRYYQDGVDELIYMDIVASLYGRNSLKMIQAKKLTFLEFTLLWYEYTLMTYYKIKRHSQA